MVSSSAKRRTEAGRPGLPFGAAAKGIDYRPPRTLRAVALPAGRYRRPGQKSLARARRRDARDTPTPNVRIRCECAVVPMFVRAYSEANCARIIWRCPSGKGKSTTHRCRYSSCAYSSSTACVPSTLTLWLCPIRRLVEIKYRLHNSVRVVVRHVVAARDESVVNQTSEPRHGGLGRSAASPSDPQSGPERSSER